MWMAFVRQGGADIVMASTSYGGSSELTDILTGKSNSLVKHKFDITGNNDIQAAIQGSLDQLSDPSNIKNLKPTTCLFVEIPTNPDMKVPEITKLATMLTEYEAQTKKRVVLLVDATFAPAS